jgi:16S rRNA (guanine(966)-N(2))-methyltransferase RsmD
LDIESLKTLDLFGGTGCISYELASRGATEQTIVEKDPKMYAFIQKNIEALNFKHIKVVKQDVFSFMQFNSEKYDFIFAGPPYALTTIDELPRIVFKQQMLNKGGWFVLEHTPRNDYKKFEHYNKERNYGTTIFSIFIQD